MSQNYADNSRCVAVDATHSTHKGENMNCQLKSLSLVIFIPFFGAMLGGCAATVPVMSKEHDIAAERFQPPLGKGNIYVVREDAFGGSAIAYKIELDGISRGSIAPGTYHLLTLEPGRHVVSSSTQENADHVAIEVVEGQNFFVEIKPTMGWIAARVSVEQIDARRGRQLVMVGERAVTLQYD